VDLKDVHELTNKSFLRRAWDSVCRLDLFTKSFLIISLLIVISVPIIIGQQTNLFSHAAVQTTVTFSSNPTDSEVWLDGQYIGNAPRSVTVSSGTHYIGFYKWGYHSNTALADNTVVGNTAMSISGDLVGGQIKAVSLSTGQAVIAFSANPADSEVWLDSKYMGNAPRSVTVSAGTHYIGFYKAGYHGNTALADNIVTGTTTMSINGNLSTGKITVNGSSAPISTPVLTLAPTAVPVSSGLLRLAMVYYGGHDATTDQRILNAKPALLIDNTPAGYWHGTCSSSKFQAAGIKVFSYIDSSYSKFDLNTNLALIDAIAKEGTYGVFLDELNPVADSYLQAIYARTKKDGVKLMVNPGMPSFDANIYNYADFVMTDEQYTGRQPSSSEQGHLAQTVVVGFQSGMTAQLAAQYTKAAWANNFGYSWHETQEYTTLPSWLETYTGLLH
jgi:hypothetical protein